MQEPECAIGHGKLLAAARPATQWRRLLLLDPTRGVLRVSPLAQSVSYRFSNPVCTLFTALCCAVTVSRLRVRRGARVRLQ